MSHQSASKQEGHHSGSPDSQITHIRFTTSNLTDHIRRPNVNKRTSTKSPAAPRGNAANRRLSQTRTHRTTSSQQSGSRRTSHAFSDNDSLFSQQTVTLEDSLPGSGQDNQSGISMTQPESRAQEDYTKVSSALVSEQPVTQEWVTQTLEDEEQEEGSEAWEPIPRDTAPATQLYTQRPPSLSPRRSLSQPTTQVSQLDTYDIPAPTTDSQQQTSSTDHSFGLSQLQCGQRLPSNTPTPGVRTSVDSQPYEEYVYEYEVPLRYSSDDEENSDGSKDDDGVIVAEDSLIAISRDTLSWSATPQGAGEVVMRSPAEDKQEDLQSDQDGIVVSTYSNRRSNSPTQSQAQSEAEAEVDEKSRELPSPEVISESEDHEELDVRISPLSTPQQSVETRGTFTSNRMDTSSISKATATSEEQARSRRAQLPAASAAPRTLTHPQRRSIPDHVKQHLSNDTLDILSHNPHVNAVFLSVDIPVLDAISGSKEKTTEAEAEESSRKRIAKGFSRRKSQLLSSQSPESPSPSPSVSPSVSPSPSPSRQSGRRTVQQDNGIERSGRRSRLRRGAHRPESYMEVQVTENDDEQEQKQVVNKEADVNEHVEHEDRGTTSSTHPRSVDTQRLPPKKRIRTQELSQENQTSERMPNQRGPRIVLDSDSDSSSDASVVLRNGRRRSLGGPKRLPSTPPPLPEEVDQEPEQDLVPDQEDGRAPESPSSQPQETSARVSDDAMGKDGDTRALEPGNEQQRWEVTKLRHVWKEHEIRWPLRTTAVAANATSSRRRNDQAEEYTANFVFGTALPLPR